MEIPNAALFIQILFFVADENLQILFALYSMNKSWKKR